MMTKGQLELGAEILTLVSEGPRVVSQWVEFLIFTLIMPRAGHLAALSAGNLWMCFSRNYVKT